MPFGRHAPLPVRPFTTEQQPFAGGQSLDVTHVAAQLLLPVPSSTHTAVEAQQAPLQGVCPVGQPVPPLLDPLLPELPDELPLDDPDELPELPDELPLDEELPPSVPPPPPPPEDDEHASTVVNATTKDDETSRMEDLPMSR